MSACVEQGKQSTRYGVTVEFRVGGTVFFSGRYIPEDARRNITSPANGYHEIWIEVIQDSGRRILAQLVHLLEDTL